MWNGWTKGESEGKGKGEKEEKEKEKEQRAMYVSLKEGISVEEDREKGERDL